MASLESLWKEGRDNALSPLEQMRAWALRAAQRDLGGDNTVNYEKMAERVTKVGGGHPTREAIRQFLARVDADPEWYPGKNYRKRAGPQAVLQGKKRKQVAKSAMNLKKEGGEPTYAGRTDEKNGEDALRRPQSKAGGDAAGGAEPWAPGGPPGGTRGHGPREVRVPPAVAHTREAMDHGHRHEATISNPGVLPLPPLGTIVL